MITFQDQARLCRADIGTDIVACDLTSLCTMEQVRIQEISEHPQVIDVTVEGRDPEDFLVVTLSDHALTGIYETLFVDRQGQVAQANPNHPRYEPTFMALVRSLHA